jgi:hypothetical protein
LVNTECGAINVSMGSRSSTILYTYYAMAESANPSREPTARKA